MGFYDGLDFTEADIAKNVRNKAEDVCNLINHFPEAGKDDAQSANDHFDKLVSSFERLGDSEEYRVAANEYNRSLGQFPANLFPIEKAPVFDRFENSAASDGEHTEKDDDDESSISNFIAEASSVIKSKVSRLSFFQIAGIIIAIAVIGKLAIGGIVKRK